MTDKNLETVWIKICGDAGWTSEMYCTPNNTLRRKYEANIDRIATEREKELRELISKARGGDDKYVNAYIDGIEAALNRAIATPRQP